MLICSSLNYSNNHYNKPSFKKVYPAVHWLRETNASYVPEFTLNNVKIVNENIIARLNKKAPLIKEEINKLTEKISELAEKLKKTLPERERIAKEKKILKYQNTIADLYLTQRIQAYLSRCDSDYARTHIARGFYINDKYRNNNYSPIAYIVTGDDALYLNELGHNIGRARSKGNIENENIARSNYWEKGTASVLKKSLESKMATGEPAELHIKMEILRNKDGSKNGFNILDMKFFPKDGPNNPFMLTDWALK